MRSPLLFTLALTTITTAAAAQTPPCEARNDGNTTVSQAITSFGFAGPNTNAWQLTPNAGTVVFAVRLFTGNTTLSGDRYMTVEIWDDASGQPGTRQAGGTWKIDAALGTDWQGANLDLPVVLNPGQPVWIVWIDPGFSVVPTEPGGLTLPAVTGSSWTPASPSALKVRLYCSQLDNQSAATMQALQK